MGLMQYEYSDWVGLVFLEINGKPKRFSSKNDIKILKNNTKIKYIKFEEKLL